MGGGGTVVRAAFSRSMNAGNILLQSSQGGANPNALPLALHDARDGAQRALFSAASRVLRYHAAALDARVARIMQMQPDDASGPQPNPANG